MSEPKHTMQLWSGKPFNLLEPKPEDITIDDVAHALSMVCRFGGHCTRHYSVAQHSLLVARLLPPELQLAGLLHDAHEAYMGDMVTALKQTLYHYEQERITCGFGDFYAPAKLADTLDTAIATAFGVEKELFHHDFIKHADLVALATERRDVLNPSTFNWMQLPKPHPNVLDCRYPYQAEEDFKRTFHDLKQGKELTHGS